MRIMSISSFDDSLDPATIPQMIHIHAGAEEEQHGKVIQLRDREGTPLFPVSSGEILLRQNYAQLVDRVLYLEERCKKLERKLGIHD